jgi:hypothetical protein
MPYFAFREHPAPTNDVSLKSSEIRRRQLMDLSFLNLKRKTAQDKKKYAIYKARSSIITCGSDNLRWVTYAFIDRDVEGGELDEDDCPYDGVQPDPIASDGRLDEGLEVLNANLPIWDAREYFLTIWKSRMTKLLKEWENLVWWVERSINEYVSGLHIPFAFFHFNTYTFQTVQESSLHY